MTIRIVANNKLDLTDDEYSMYQSICISYDRDNMKGKDLFLGLFESDDAGNIMFLRPPSQRHTSLEVYLFCASIMLHQQIRVGRAEMDALCIEMRNKIKLLDQRLNENKNDIQDKDISLKDANKMT